MPKKCFVPDCENVKNYGTSGISFHKFPSDVHLQNKWLQQIKSPAKVGPNDVICSDHFLPGDIWHLGKRGVLRNNAVPRLICAEKSASVLQESGRMPCGSQECFNKENMQWSEPETILPDDEMVDLSFEDIIEEDCTIAEQFKLTADCSKSDNGVSKRERESAPSLHRHFGDLEKLSNEHKPRKVPKPNINMSKKEKPAEDSILKTPAKREKVAQDSLMALETLDRSSPDLWPEKNFLAMSNTPIASSPPQWTKGLTQEDINAIHQLGTLPSNGLITEIKKLYDQAYQLGITEAKEMTRGKYLGIFSNSKRK